MANYVTVGGISGDEYGNMVIQAASPFVGGTFGGWNGNTNSYGLGSNCFIDTPNVTTIPGSSVSSNACNGERTNCGIVNQDGGSEATNIFGGNCGTLSTLGGGGSGYLGYLEVDSWTAQYTTFSGDASTWGNPINNTGTVQEYPGNISVDTDLYTITMLGGTFQGQSVVADQGFRISYNASVGNLATTLLAVAPIANAGFPSNINFGKITSGMNDEQAAAVWLAFGYGLFKGNGTNTIPAFWTTT